MHGLKTTRSTLDGAAFEALLAALHPDRNEAGRAYERLRRRLIRFFTLHGAAGPDDLADEALDRLARRLHEGESIRQLPGYLAGIAHLLLREEWARLQRDGRNARLGVAAGMPASDDDSAHEALEACLQTMPAASRELIYRYYSSEARANAQGRKKLADELGVSVNALRNRAFRLRQELEKCVKGRLTEGPGQDIKQKNLTRQPEGERPE